ncbi:hypothetical protein Q8A67_019132 [Cirrhinus molitorella]|nr:hypothetical protein Q8A67_019132 [Cirrhinus molitorella]
MRLSRSGLWVQPGLTTYPIHPFAKATLLWLPGYQLIKVAKRGIMENRATQVALDNNEEVVLRSCLADEGYSGLTSSEHTAITI